MKTNAISIKAYERSIQERIPQNNTNIDEQLKDLTKNFLKAKRSLEPLADWIIEMLKSILPNF